jgi:AcrR family transcriptional regulator
LLDAALAVIEREDVKAVKIRALAKSLRVSAAAPFRHFAGREALLVALAEEGAALLARRMDEAAARESDPLEAQRARGIASVRFAVESPGYFKLLTHPSIFKASAKLRALSASQTSWMEPILSRHHRGAVSPAVARRSAGMLAGQALTYGLSRMMLDGLLGKVSPADAERLARELTGVLGQGLLAPERSANEPHTDEPRTDEPRANEPRADESSTGEAATSA